jgi:hypothetical protein
MLWGPIRPARARLRPPVFSFFTAYLADRPPAGPDWQHRKWGRYPIIARQDGDRVHTHGRAPGPTTRPAWIALDRRWRPCRSARLSTSTGKPLGSMLKATRASGPCGSSGRGWRSDGRRRPLEMDGQDIAAKRLAGPQEALARLLRRPTGKAAQKNASGVVVTEAIEGAGEATFRKACHMGLALCPGARLVVCEHADAQLTEGEKPSFWAPSRATFVIVRTISGSYERRSALSPGRTP